jgi:flagellar biosynthesis/type III secretory pathway protein FliH
MSLELEIVNYCTCGQPLEAQYNTDLGKLVIETEPCDRCAELDREQGYEEGYDKGLEAGEAEGYNEGYRAGVIDAQNDAEAERKKERQEGYDEGYHAGLMKESNMVRKIKQKPEL